MGSVRACGLYRDGPLVRWSACPALLAAIAAVAAGCGGGDEREAAPALPEEIQLASPELATGKKLPAEVTCDGLGSPPGLDWSGVPRDARELALVVLDPDAPDGPFLHWSAWGIDPGDRVIPAGGFIEKGPVEGENDFGEVGYGPPCPPEGDSPHRYTFTLYALSAPLDLDQGAPPDEVLDRIDQTATAQGSLIGEYAR